MTYPKLPKAFKKKWLKALRSGKFEQGDGVLKDIYNDENGKDTIQYCCLGVACEVVGAKVPFKKNSLGFIIPKEGIRGITKVPKELVGDSEENKLVDKLSNMNDNGKSFEVIADWIEENL